MMNTFEVDGKLYEKETAFPSPEGDQLAYMVRWNGKEWELSGWNAFIDEAGQTASGWECFNIGRALRVLGALLDIMGDIEEEEGE